MKLANSIEDTIKDNSSKKIVFYKNYNFIIKRK